MKRKEKLDVCIETMEEHLYAMRSEINATIDLLDLISKEHLAYPNKFADEHYYVIRTSISHSLEEYENKLADLVKLME